MPITRMVLIFSAIPIAAEPEIAPEHEEHETAEPSHGHHAAQLHHTRHNQGMLILLWIIVVAVGQNVCDRGADLIS